MSDSGETGPDQAPPASGAPPVSEAPPADGGPLDDFGKPALGPERSGAAAVLTVLVLIVLGLGAGYAWAVVNAGDRLATGTRVAGVDVGGVAPAAAEVRLRNALATRASQEVDLSVGDEQVTRPPGALGLSVDYRGSIDQVVGGPTWEPANLWRFYTGGGTHDPVVAVDRSVFVPLVDGLVANSERAPREGSIVFDGDGYEVVEPVVGTRLDRDAAVATLRAEWLSPGVVELPLADAPPAIDAEDVARATSEIAEPAVSGPVRLRVAGQVLRLRPQDYTDLISVTPVDGALTLAVNQERLPLRVALRLDRAGELEPGRDAEIVIDDGLPEVVPAVAGEMVDPEPLVQRFREAVLAPDTADRVLRVPVVDREPQLTTAQAEDLGVTEEVAEVSVGFSPAAFRDTNLPLAAAALDGTVLLPGESLSFNDTVGAPTPDRGFVQGPLYDDGQAFTGAGAGLSRLATALSSASWQAGLDLQERTPMPWHPEAYPIGTDAAVQFGSVDLVVSNPSPYGVLVTAAVDGTEAPDGAGGREVTVQLWSTRWREVRTSLSAFTDQVSPASEFVATTPCVGVSGQPGFDVTATRTLVRPGTGEREGTDELSTSYRPLPNVVCVTP